MAFTQQFFCGASLRSFNAQLSWGVGAPSQFTAQLVEDPAHGDVFSPPNPGEPVYFNYSGFTFNGIFQKSERTQSSEGKPLFEVTVLDPREILEGVPLILGGYSASIGTIKNLQNIFGYWESFGFGSSLVNDSGMLFSKLKAGLLALTNQPNYLAYGGPITFKGTKYGLNLDQLPTPPAQYRVGSASANLLEVIAQVCEDCGADFMVELVGTTIRVRTVSRLTQPALGTISAYVNNTSSNQVVRSKSGVELRNETTSSFLTGGDICVLNLTAAAGIRQFWGYDPDGSVIVGTQGVLNLYGRPPTDPPGPAPLLTSVATEFVSLNASPVADIIGNLRYACTTLEMRLAQGGYDTWASFIRGSRPEIAPYITSPIANLAANGNAIGQMDVINDGAADAAQLAAVASDYWAKAMRLYEFIKSSAQEYLGKKFLVSIPLISQKIDPDTLRVSYSYDVTDGGYLPEGSTPLGLSALNADIFKLPDGRFSAFVQYALDAGVDINKIGQGNSVVQNNILYVQVQVSPQIIFTPYPAVVITVSEPVHEAALDPFGDSGLLVRAALQLNPAEGQPILAGRGAANVGLRVEPATRSPVSAAIPLKSNIATYGPWYVVGAAGKVKYESDSSLVPWNFGGFAQLELAGLARVTSAVTNMQVSEAGEVEVVGAPAASLGDTLQSGGPNITNMSVSFGPQGVTTTYAFRTFTPKFGLFGKANYERIKKLGLTAQELRKAQRASVRSTISRAEDLSLANRTATFMANAPAAVRRQSPHGVFIGHSFAGASGETRTGISTTTYQEAVGLSQAASGYQSTAMMSLNGLIRPFSTCPGSGERMPSLENPSIFGDIPNSVSLNPWKAANDVEILAYGSNYEGLHASRRGYNGAYARPFALRAPLVCEGWGYGLDGMHYPGDSGNWSAGVLTASDTWKVGPLETFWCDKRKIWTSGGSLRGTTTSTVAASGLAAGTMTVAVASGTPWILPVYNFSSAEVSLGKAAVATFISAERKWFLVAVDC